MKDVQKDAYSASKAMREIIIILLTYVHTKFNLLGVLKVESKNALLYNSFLYWNVPLLNTYANFIEF